jgi:hypothetical protein
MPVRDWKAALNRFMIEFEEQLAPSYLNWAVTQFVLQPPFILISPIEPMVY